MKTAAPGPADSQDNPDIPLPLSRPTEAEIRAADLERGADPDGDPDDQGNSDNEDREARIRRAAYAAAEQRGFEPGHELEDWLAAEAEVGHGTLPP